jgi:hypothetical protein
MKVLTNRNVFAGVARRVAVNTAWATVFVVPVILLTSGSNWSPLLLLVTLSILALVYGLALLGTVGFAKWLIPRTEKAAEFEAASDEAKANWIVSCAWWT